MPTVRDVTAASTAAGSMRMVTRVDLDKVRPRTGPLNRLGRRRERVRHGDNLVARLHPERLERHKDRFGAVRSADTVACLDELSHLGFEGRHKRPVDKGASGDDSLDSRHDLVANGLELGAEVYQRNPGSRHDGHGVRSPVARAHLLLARRDAQTVTTSERAIACRAFLEDTNATDESICEAKARR